MSQVFHTTKDPGSLGDWSFNWADQLGTAAISTSSWEIEGPDALLTISSNAFTDSATSVTLNGGTEGLIYRAKNTITTDVGGRWVRTLHVEMVKK